MDVGNDNGWNFDKVVTKKEMLEQIGQHFEIEPVESSYFGEVATYYRHKDNGAQFGLLQVYLHHFVLHVQGKNLLRWKILWLSFC